MLKIGYYCPPDYGIHSLGNGLLPTFIIVNFSFLFLQGVFFSSIFACYQDILSSFPPLLIMCNCANRLGADILFGTNCGGTTFIPNIWFCRPTLSYLSSTSLLWYWWVVERSVSILRNSSFSYVYIIRFACSPEWQKRYFQYCGSTPHLWSTWCLSLLEHYFHRFSHRRKLNNICMAYFHRSMLQSVQKSSY